MLFINKTSYFLVFVYLTVVFASFHGTMPMIMKLREPIGKSYPFTLQ